MSDAQLTVSEEILMHILLDGIQYGAQSDQIQYVL